VFFSSPQDGVLKGSARGNPWCHAILESRVEALNEYRIKVDPPVWQFDLPADILPRETNFVAEQITANFLRMIVCAHKGCHFSVLTAFYRRLSKDIVKITTNGGQVMIFRLDTG
jgi:hypothetical protein